jgi:hypothetical protein
LAHCALHNTQTLGIRSRRKFSGVLWRAERVNPFEEESTGCLSTQGDERERVNPFEEESTGCPSTQGYERQMKQRGHNESEGEYEKDDTFHFL